MKLIYCLVGLTLLAGCSSKDGSAPAPSDPFLGHWQAATLRTVNYDASGKVLTDDTESAASQLDATATALTFTSVVHGTTEVETDPYVRSGELLTLTLKYGTAGETYYARNLTDKTFTFEFDGPRTSGKPYYVQTIPYTR